MELAVYNINGQDTGKKVTLNDEVFAIPEPNEHVVYLSVKQYLGNQRQGTHKSKERSEIMGSTKKLGRQKGGGGARHGDIKSPLFHGGGRVFGPRLIVVEDFSFDAPKTKDFVAMTKALNVEGKKVMLVLNDINKNVYLSVRNVESASVCTARELNTYRVLDNRAMIVTESSIEVMNKF